MKQQREIKWDFSNYDYNGMIECPTCIRLKESRGLPVALAHPEEIPFLCKKHLKMFEEWHDKSVKAENIKSWFKEKND